MESASQSERPAGGSAPERIHPEASVGAVRLNVADLDRAEAFYETAIGLRPIDRVEDTARLGTAGAVSVVELVRRPDAPPRPPRTSGLFHLAILVGDRAELARALRRVSDAGWSLSGAADHLVSEALYLRDPEGNGIEIYRDRPREEWPRADGQVQMDSLPLDIEGLLAEPGGAGSGGGPMAAGTRIGHVHLNVADLAAAETFYAGVLGFDVTVRGYPGALFLSAGGYHHHIGVNTWAGAGAPPPPPGSLGLSWFEIVVPDRDELGRIEGRIRAAGIDARGEGDGVQVTDPSGNGILLRPARQDHVGSP